MQLMHEISRMCTEDGNHFNVADLRNRPFPSLSQPPFQSEAKREVFVEIGRAHV